MVSLDLGAPRDSDDPQAYLDELEAVAAASAGEPCPDCGADWTVELWPGGAWVITREHEDSCPLRPRHELV